MERKKKTRKFIIVLLCIAALAAMVLIAAIVKNLFGSDFERLNETDRAILSEYNTFCASLEESDIWEGYNLNEKTILAMPGEFSGGYLINPEKPVSGIFAKEITVPDDWTITVYRLSAATPDLMQFRLSGDFNTVGETYSVLGSDVYFIKYDQAASVDAKWSSEHFTTFLSHEAFHYYMQDTWPEGSRFSADSLTEDDIALLEEEYGILGDIQTQLLSDAPDKTALEESAKEYVDVVNRRMAANEDYVQKEMSAETMEGTATYAGIQASRRVGYDFGVMYFSNRKDVPFSEIITQYRAGNIDKSYLADRIPYETGGLLCLLMDELGVPKWQDALNSQTLDAPVSLYSILKAWVER